MIAPVPALTVSAKLGRYSSLTVLSADQSRDPVVVDWLTIDVARDIMAVCPRAVDDRASTHRLLLVQEIVLGAGDESRGLHASDCQKGHGRG